MSLDAIKFVLESGECPTCKAEVTSDDTMTSFLCSKDGSHFTLQVTFHGGEKITAKLNGQEVPEDELKKIDW